MPDRTNSIQHMTMAQWETAFPTEEACLAYLVAHRWPTAVKCPRCGNTDLYTVNAFRWQCHDCGPQGYRFSHIAGTIFGNTKQPLRVWFRVIHMMLTSKKGISAAQVNRMMGFGSYKTAYYMCRKIRAGLANEEFLQLMGIMAIDETYNQRCRCPPEVDIVHTAPPAQDTACPKCAAEVRSEVGNADDLRAIDLRWMGDRLP